MLKSCGFLTLRSLSGRELASKSGVASTTVENRYRRTNWFKCLAVVCFATVLLSTTVQATHFCGLRALDAPASVELSPASSGTPVCLTCLMARSSTAIVLLIAFVIMSGCAVFVGGLQMRPHPVLYSFRLYIRPPPFVLA